MKKKIVAVLMTAAMSVSLAACGTTAADNSQSTTTADADTTSDADTTAVSTDETSDTAADETVSVMSYDEYMSAATDSEVTIDCIVMDTQSWWDGKISVYAFDPDSNKGYFIYNMTCSEDDAAKLVLGQEIIVTGYKSEWAGEVEIAEGATFTFGDLTDTAPAVADVTELIGTDDLAEYMNSYVVFSGMTVDAVSYKNDTPGDDIYVTLSKDGVPVEFCLEYYLNGDDAELYDTVGTLTPGSVVDAYGYLYWYEGADAHITAIDVVSEALDGDTAAVMTYDEYIAAETDSEVTIDCVVMDTQSWWDGKISVYACDPETQMGYFIYNMACEEADAEALVAGQEIIVTGYKSEWAGEVEIAEGATFTFGEMTDYVPAAVDVTALIGTDDLAEYMNSLVAFTDMTVDAVSYKNDTPGDDIYVTLSKDGTQVNFCLEYYLNGDDAELYDTVGNLEIGSTVDVQGYLYWYEGADAHITGIIVK